MRYIVLAFFLFPSLSRAQNIKYAFQSVEDKDRLTFVSAEARDRTILYINEKCTTCLVSLKRIRKALVDRRVSVVVSTNNMNYLRNLVKKNAPRMSGFIYYDPGRRLQRDLDLKDVQFSYIVFSGGSFRKYNSNGSVVTPPPKIYKR